MTQVNLSAKQKQTHRCVKKTDWWLPSGWGWGLDWGYGVNRCKPLYKRCINKKILLYSTGKYIPHPVINHNGQEHEKDIYICNRSTLLYTRN